MSHRSSLPAPGLRYMAYGAFWFSVMSLLVKIAGAHLPTVEVVLVRSVVTLVLSAAMLRHAGVAPWGRRHGRLVLRGVLGFCALLCFYYALTHLPIADATVLQYMNPVFTALLAAGLLGERLALGEVAATAVSLAGVVLVARPSVLFGGAVALPLHAVAIALLGALCSASAYVTVRSMGRAEHPLVVVFYFPLVSVPLGLPLVLPVWVWPTAREWAVLAGVGIATQIAQVYLTKGLQLEPAGRATAVGYLQVVFAAVWGLLFFGERPGLWTVGGTLLVAAGTLALTTLHQRRAGRIEPTERAAA
ncbi:MAG TPA: DMT family transporter [Gemmatimonadaceae bacterium]|nr:DMT family transporter [Gemmatimonadaceae bacterium]